MAEFGDRLKKEREKKGWNQEQLAQAMDLSQASISQFEKGQRLPTPNNITKFAKVLGVSREYLAGENEGDFETQMLMRNIKNLSQEDLRKINEWVEMLKKSLNK
jgi:transcriptional regulator with XRE-family HTH domain